MRVNHFDEFFGHRSDTLSLSWVASGEDYDARRSSTYRTANAVPLFCFQILSGNKIGVDNDSIDML